MGISFSKIMPLIALHTDNPDVDQAVRAGLSKRCVVARTASWARFLYLVRERPVTCAVVDEGALRFPPGSDGALAELRTAFPSVAVVLISRPQSDPFMLLRLGRVGIDGLVLMGTDDVTRAVQEAVARALARGTEALVARALSSYVPARSYRALRLALEGVQRNWRTADLARQIGYSRPHLSWHLRSDGLPSAGHLLVWARLLHAGRWLTDPGRSAESVSRQLEYSSGAAFRRALRNYTGATPTRVSEEGGFRFVLEHFRRCCGIGQLGRKGLSVA
jgi:AraC-like DNA-binding protein